MRNERKAATGAERRAPVAGRMSGVCVTVGPVYRGSASDPSGCLDGPVVGTDGRRSGSAGRSSDARGAARVARRRARTRRAAIRGAASPDADAARDEAGSSPGRRSLGPVRSGRYTAVVVGARRPRPVFAGRGRCAAILASTGVAGHDTTVYVWHQLHRCDARSGRIPVRGGLGILSLPGCDLAIAPTGLVEARISGRRTSSGTGGAAPGAGAGSVTSPRTPGQ